MTVTFLPHALERMAVRGISEQEAIETLEHPDAEYPGARDRWVAERVPVGKFLAVKVVYNYGTEDEVIVISVMRARPKPRLVGGNT